MNGKKNIFIIAEKTKINVDCMEDILLLRKKWRNYPLYMINLEMYLNCIEITIATITTIATMIINQ